MTDNDHPIGPPGVLRMMVICITSLLVATGLVPTLALADTVPEGEVVLVIDGAIDSGVAEFDMAALMALPRHEINTRTPWNDGEQQFAGTRLSDLLALVGAKSSNFLAIGYDEYQAEFSGVDLERYPVILAWEHNQEPMSIRQLGPLRIIFPFDDYPELLNHLNDAMSVWQIVHMTVRE